MRFAKNFTLILLFSQFVGSSYAADSETMTWNLRNDFGVAPNQSNPDPDQYGNPAVWHYLMGPTVHTPSAYVYLSTFLPNSFGINGLASMNGFTGQEIEPFATFWQVHFSCFCLSACITARITLLRYRVYKKRRTKHILVSKIINIFIVPEINCKAAHNGIIVIGNSCSQRVCVWQQTIA